MKIRPEVKEAVKVLGIEKLRKNQAKPVNSLLDGHDTVARAATGFGKSLIYLVPGIISKDLTIVIEPLLALMHEQVKRLRALGIEAEYIDHTRASADRLGICKKCRDGTLIILALSATIPPGDCGAVRELLSMGEPKLFTFPLYRSNLVFMKKGLASSMDKLREAKKAPRKYHGEGTAIIFCATKTLAEQLKKKYKGEVTVYHSGKKKRSPYADGKRHIIVATSALSMGVDIPHVDLVINFNMPLSLSDFSQMAGRAGREGQTSRCLLLWSRDDYPRNRYMLEAIQDARSRRRALDMLEEMKEYCDDKKHCMVKSMLNALGDDYDHECRYCTICQEKRRAMK